MKNLIYLSCVLVVFILAGCNSKPKTEKSSALTGIWQNEKDSSTAIEFSENGNYDLRVHGQRISEMSSGDSLTQKFLYDSLSNVINLRIYDDKNKDTVKCKLVFINQGRIKLSMIFNDTVISEAEYFKVKI